MKTKILIILCTSFLSIKAQFDCTQGRFVDRMYFDSVSVVPDVLFGSNLNVANTSFQDLYLNFFEPFGDTMLKRPLIILAFGGSFVNGDRESMYELCDLYAKMGYTCASIDYRVDIFFPPNQVNTANAVMRGAAHDMKSAIRYFIKDAQTLNQFKIDTNMLIIGGISAGAISALHAAYLDKNIEFPAYLDSTSIGGIDGNSGNIGYHFDIKGILNFSGAIGDTSWIETQDDIATYSVHDTGDAIVPFKTEEIYFAGVYPTGLVASGSRDIHARLLNLGTNSALTPYNTSSHVSYFSDPANSELVFNESVVFMENNVVCKYPLSSKDQQTIRKSTFMVYPNPTSTKLSIHSTVALNQYDVTVYDLFGNIVLHQTFIQSKNPIDIEFLTPGTYLIRVFSGTNYYHQSFVKL